MKHVCLLLFSLATVIGSNLFAAPASQPSKEGVRVTLLLFSGRPNPTFVVTDPELLAKLSQQVRQMPSKAQAEAQAKSVIPNRLGYRGIEITGLSAALPGIESMQVYRTGVELKKLAPPASLATASVGPATELRSDVNSEIENLLVQEAVKRKLIDQNALAHIYQQ